MGQRIEITEVSFDVGHKNLAILHGRFARLPACCSDLCQQHMQTVDFSFNALADPGFTFHDHALVEAVKMENPEVHAFFRLLSLCHTVMAEEKKEGGGRNHPHRCLLKRAILKFLVLLQVRFSTRPSLPMKAHW